MYIVSERGVQYLVHQVRAPPQVATDTRDGWTMGAIQNTYLRYEAAGDQYVGSVVSGLLIRSAKFGVLPP